MIHASGYPVV